MTVQPLIKSQLIDVMPNESSCTAQNKDGIQNTHLQVFVCFVSRKTSRLTKKIHKCNSYCSIDVQNQITSFPGCNLFHFQSILKQRSCREFLSNEFFHNFDSSIRVLQRFHPMPNSHDVFV